MNRIYSTLVRILSSKNFNIDPMQLILLKNDITIAEAREKQEKEKLKAEIKADVISELKEKFLNDIKVDVESKILEKTTVELKKAIGGK